MSLDALTKMGIPTTSVFHSFNGKVQLAGFDVIRIERANFTISNMADIYPEVGRREGTPYVKEFDVRGTFSRAYVNGAEWRLAIGMKSGEEGFDPGKIYENPTDGGNPFEILFPVTKKSFSNKRTTKNVYPIKHTVRLEVNSIDDVPQAYGAGALYALITGVLINTSTIVLGQGGDLIMTGPVNWIGEEVEFSII